LKFGNLDLFIMAKAIKAIVKLQLPAAKATPAPPVGTALGPHGVNIADFVKQFNDQTAQMGDMIIPAEMTIYEDRSFTFILKTPPAANLIMKAIGLAKGSGNPLMTKVGKITKAQVREIAEKKMPDLNATSVEAAEKIIAGTARSMGVDVID
jgi:large subunit ribosomal protein L11